MLLAEAGEHEIFRSAYTRDGTLTYQPDLVAFSFRYEVRDSGDDPAEAEHRVVAIAMDRARAALDARGIGFKHLRATATDMASVWDASPAGLADT